MNLLTLIAITISFLLFTLSISSVNAQLATPQSIYKTIKAKDTEKFVIPFNASNYERNKPLIYTFQITWSELDFDLTK